MRLILLFTCLLFCLHIQAAEEKLDLRERIQFSVDAHQSVIFEYCKKLKCRNLSDHLIHQNDLIVAMRGMTKPSGEALQVIADAGVNARVTHARFGVAASISGASEKTIATCTMNDIRAKLQMSKRDSDFMLPVSRDCNRGVTESSVKTEAEKLETFLRSVVDDQNREKR